MVEDYGKVSKEERLRSIENLRNVVSTELLVSGPRKIEAGRNSSEDQNQRREFELWHSVEKLVEGIEVRVD